MRIESARFIRSVVEKGTFIDDDRPEIAFVGRSNVGKSSLLNRLLNRKALARISSTPGRTRAVNYFLINERFYFVDLPGYGYARVAKTERQSWGRLMDEYLRRAAGNALIVQIVDAKVGATKLDLLAWDYLQSLGISPLVVATKTDRLKRAKQAQAIESIRRTLDGARAVVAFSARSGTGGKELWAEIDCFLEAPSISDSSRGISHG